MIVRKENEKIIHFGMRIIWREIKKIYCYLSYIKYYVFSPKLNPYQTENEITVSFTTYPERVKWLPIVVGSLVRQTMQPSRIVLYLSKEQFDNLNNPIFKKIQKQGVLIKLKEDDLRSHKKYIYAMKEYPDSIIVTVDDDIIYDKYLIENLYESYLKHPFAISAKRVHQIKFDNNKVCSYNHWGYDYRNCVDTESLSLIATGCGGILYPPNILYKKWDDIEIIKGTCIKADDIWLKIMELMNSVPVVLVQSKNYKLNHIWSTDMNGLACENVTLSANDSQLLSICDEMDIDLFTLINKK